MLLGNTVKFTHMTLGLVPEVLNAIDVVGLVCKQFGMVDTEVFKVRYIQHVIALPSALQKAKYRDFSGRTTTTLPFALATKITFVNLDLATENRVRFLLKIMRNDFS